MRGEFKNEPITDFSRKENRAKMEEALREARFATPKENQLPEVVGASAGETALLLDLLLDGGEVVRLGGGVVLHREALESAKETISDFVGKNGPRDLDQERSLKSASAQLSGGVGESIVARRPLPLSMGVHTP